jgi:hypothetical protein
MSMLDRIYSNYDSGAATVSDGENDEDLSHGSQSENDRAAGYLASQSHAILSAMSHDDDDDDSSDEMASAEIDDMTRIRVMGLMAVSLQTMTTLEIRFIKCVFRHSHTSLDFVCRLFCFELVFPV